MSELIYLKAEQILYRIFQIPSIEIDDGQPFSSQTPATQECL